MTMSLQVTKVPTKCPTDGDGSRDKSQNGIHDGPFIKKINSVHINKILDIQGKKFKDLPMMPKHTDKENEKSVL